MRVPRVMAPTVNRMRVDATLIVSIGLGKRFLPILLFSSASMLKLRSYACKIA